MEWEKFRRKDGSIDLKSAFTDYYQITDVSKSLESIERRYDYIERIEEIQLITSRQAAAMVIATAWTI